MFNPPYSKNVKTKIAKHFLSLIDSHFPREHKFHKIFNRNNVKISYSCSPNLKQHINTHNTNITKNKIPNNERTCNCINKDLCPLQQQCLTTCIVYQADLTSIEHPQHTKSYIGISETTFKKRCANHKKAFNIEKYKNDTALSKELWKIKEKKSYTNN